MSSAAIDDVLDTLITKEVAVATRVTLPPIADPARAFADDVDASPIEGLPAAPVTVAKVQLLNDRGDRPAEAAWLRDAARPGVVELLSTSDDPFTIVTAHAGARTMRTARLEPDDGLALVLQTAELLAGLHRDGFVHGKLTVDHVIVGTTGPVLCSPEGTIADPAVDLHGIARCLRELDRQWDEAGISPPWRGQWTSLAQRLEDDSDPSSSATRVAHALRRMQRVQPAEAPVAPGLQRLPRGLLIGAGAAVIALAGLVLVPGGGATATGPLVEIDGATYAVGDEGDDVAHLDTPCDADAPLVILRPSTGEVWAFTTLGDQQQSTPAAVVPGATELRAERRSDTGCDVAVARGPAGSTVIDTAALLG